MIVEIQCIPRPPGTADDRYAHVHAAVEVVGASGLTHEVGALGTTVEGEPDEVWPLLRRVHEASLAAGAESVVTVVKVLEVAGDGRSPTIASLTDRYRS